MHSRRTFAAGLAAAPFAYAGATNPADLSLTEAAALIRRKALTPLELTEACLARIEKLNPRLNAFITVLREGAAARAKTLKPEQVSRQPLHGIPLALKDLYDTVGIRTTAASAQWRDRVPTADATVVTRLHEAGAVLVGKANLDEFAYNFTSETSVFGAAHNPWQVDCSPGGSSGGSAIAVAAGMALAALGSDTGGSIRLPAAFCGITGFKPTYGRIPTAGAAPLSWSLDHVGPMTRTAEDAAVLHRVLTGRPLQLGPVKDLRLAIARRPYWDDLEPENEKLLHAAVDQLKRATRSLGEVTMPELGLEPALPFPACYRTVIFTEAFTYHREMLAQHPERYHAGTRSTIELGRAINAPDYINARREMERLRETAAATLFRDADVILTPTSPGPAFRLGSQPSLVNLRNTAPWNVYGLPTVTVPAGFTAAELPVGLQITGAPDRDDVVLSVAAEFQRRTDFHARRPPVS